MNNLAVLAQKRNLMLGIIRKIIKLWNTELNENIQQLLLDGNELHKKYKS